MTDGPLLPGSVVWIDLDPVVGREQGGRRPAVVVAAPQYLEVVSTLVIVVPITTVDRGWSNHVRIGGASGLAHPSWAITEQPRTVAVQRIASVAGTVSDGCLAVIMDWLGDFLDL